MEIMKAFTFAAAHKLGDEGPCSRIHGHTYRAVVWIDGTVGGNGMVMDFHRLDEILGPIRARLDHAYLNDVMETPTTENIVLWLARECVLAGLDTVSCVEVYESDTTGARWRQ